MDCQEVYHWMDMLQAHLGLGKWQAQTLAKFAIGVIETRRCTLNIVAEKIAGTGRADSMERTLQRFLANGRLARHSLQSAWARWVLSRVNSEGGLTLLVDETKLGDHLNVMVVGLAHGKRCIPLAWRCYAPKAWPAGQVEVIQDLLEIVKVGAPPQVNIIVQADQGIGTSPRLVQIVQALGWHYLFRVQGVVLFKSKRQTETQLRKLIQRGELPLTDVGEAFKKAGWLPTHICLHWEKDYDQAWYLITDMPDISGREYAQRNWQEQSFRDFKSGGWLWNLSRVWKPDHAERLVLVLALAYAVTLSFGSAFEPEGEFKHTQSKRWSLFTKGWHYFKTRIRLYNQRPFCLNLSPPPTLDLLYDFLLAKSVV